MFEILISYLFTVLDIIVCLFPEVIGKEIVNFVLFCFTYLLSQITNLVIENKQK